MIQAKCECGVACTVGEANIATPLPPCPQCGRPVRFACAEPLAEGQGAGDFDSRLVFIGGPDRGGEQVLLGGCCQIEIGKLPERHLQLTGQKVSRLHCRLVRLDFGPSCWGIEDNHSTNGLYVNGQRVTAPVELKDGDVIAVGEYLMRYATDAARAAAPPAAPVKAVPVGGVDCPSCGKPTFAGAMICTDCGIYIHSGRPLVTARGVDQERVDEVAREALWLPSFFMLLGFLPVASEAYGAHKPKSTWTILAITVVCSIAYFLVSCTPSANSPDVQNMMIWNGDRTGLEERARARLQELKKIEADVEEEAHRIPDRYLFRFRRELAEERDDIAVVTDHRIGFRPHQLLTHALIHDTSWFVWFILHLGSNTLFLLVFGLRINELIGNVRMAIIYPLLAVSSALVDLWATRYREFGSGLGASGAVAGLAGMYFILFPVQRVRMVAFCNLWLFTAFMCLTKPFWIRGFWLLLLWFAVNDLLPLALQWEDDVGHWAHLGGFVSGVVVALVLLVTRQVYARGDLLSVALGKRAWWIVGKPSRFAGAPAAPSPEAPATAPAQGVA